MGLLKRMGNGIAGAFGFGGTSRPAEPPVTETAGTGGTQVIGGNVVNRETNPDMANPRSRFKRYGELQRNVEIVATAVHLTSRIMRGVTWTAVAPKFLRGADPVDADEKAVLVDDILADMTTPISTVAAKLGMFTYMGFALAEWTAKVREDGVIGLLDIEMRPQSTIEKWDVDASGTVVGVEQRSPVTQNAPVYLHRNRLVYAVSDVIDDAPDGVGLFRHIVSAANRLEVCLGIEKIGLENDIRGVLVGRAPLGELNKLVGQPKPGTAGGVYTTADVSGMLSGLTDFMEGHKRTASLSLLLESGVFLDAAKNPTGPQKWGAEILQGEGGPFAELQAAISRETLAIARLLGIEHVLIGGGDSGSWALSSEKILMHKLLIDSTLAELATVLRRDVLVPLWQVNGWDPRVMPTLQPEAVALRSVTEAIDLLVKLSQAGLDDDDEARDILRDRVGLPPAPRTRGDLLTDPNAVEVDLTDLGAEPDPAAPPADAAPAPDPAADPGADPDRPTVAAKRRAPRSRR